MKEFIAIVKEQMRLQDISVKVLAERIGISVTYVYALLAGEKRFNEDTIKKISDLLGVSIRYFPTKSQPKILRRGNETNVKTQTNSAQ